MRLVQDFYENMLMTSALIVSLPFTTVKIPPTS